jgi:hypothetical protein
MHFLLNPPAPVVQMGLFKLNNPQSLFKKLAWQLLLGGTNVLLDV